VQESKIKPHWDSQTEYEDFDVSLVPDHNNAELISTLVMAMRPQHVLPALMAVRHRLTERSTIFLVTEGLGVVEEIYAKVFPNVDTRPQIVLGISSHMIQRLPASRDPHFLAKEESYFRVLRWKQLGTLSISPLPRWSNRRDPEAFRRVFQGTLPPTTRYLLRTLRRTPILVPTIMRPVDFYLLQLENLGMQSILQSMASLTDSRQSHLLYNWYYTVSMRVIAHEISTVFRALPEIKSYPNLEERFSPVRMLRMVTGACFERKNLVNPAVYEMRSGRKTSVEYLNGWIVKRGEEMGLKPVVNYFVQHLCRGKSLMVRHEVEEEMDLAAEEYPPEMLGSPKYN
jgi:2-dehydropantoate 2-reductase